MKTIIDLKPGDRVKAFHPRRFGVVNYGTVVRTTHKGAHIDFGQLLGGTFFVSYSNILELA